MLADGNDMSFGWRIVIEGAGSKASSPARSAGAPEIVLFMENQLLWNLENDTPNEIITEAVNEFAQNICVVIVLKLPNFQTRNFRIRFFMFLLMDPII